MKNKEDKTLGWFFRVTTQQDYTQDYDLYPYEPSQEHEDHYKNDQWLKKVVLMKRIIRNGEQKDLTLTTIKG